VTKLGVQETQVETNIVAHHDAIAEACGNVSDYVCEYRSVDNLARSYPVDSCGTNVAAGIYEGRPFRFRPHPRVQRDDPDFDDAVVSARKKTGRFNIDDSETCRLSSSGHIYSPPGSALDSN
jgi:hypothetical protein